MQPLTQHFCLTSQGNCWSQTGWFSEPTQQRRRRRLTDFEGGGERECKHGEYGSVQMMQAMQCLSDNITILGTDLSHGCHNNRLELFFSIKCPIESIVILIVNGTIRCRFIW